MVAWSRSLSPIRKELGFLDDDEQSEDLVDVHEDESDEGCCRRTELSLALSQWQVGYYLTLIEPPRQRETIDRPQAIEDWVRGRLEA